jgi:hypothetical protein
MRTVSLAMLAVLLLPALPRAGAEEDPELWPDRLRVRKSGAVKLVARFPSEVLPAGFRPDAETVEIAIGPATVLSTPPVDDRAAYRPKDGWRWRYREKRSKDRPGVRRLSLDLAAGRLVFRAKRLDVESILGTEPAALSVTLRLGDAVFTGTVDARRSGKGFRFKAKRPPLVPIGPGPPPGDTGSEVAFRALLGGLSPDAATPENRVFASRAEYESFYAAHPGIWPSGSASTPPSVDFGSEIAIGVFLGTALGNSYAVEIARVMREGDALVVTSREIQPGSGCPVPMLIGYPYAIVAVPKVTGPVSFVRTVLVKSCP